MCIANFIDVSPAMRYMRSLSACRARIGVNRQKKECTWCGGAVPRPRIYWCSDECSKAFFSRCDQATAKGIAVEAATIARAVVFSERTIKGELYVLRGGAVVLCGICEEPISEYAAELDHILPVCEGGGLCGQNNYRLLCKDCHKAESAKGTRRRARARKAAVR